MTIQTFTLDNGMQVLLEENHAAKVVSFNALVKVGSAYESDDEAGICHVIEHMLFKGTPSRPAGTIARDVEAAGGEINAYTSIDQTVFYINMATLWAEKGLETLADAMMNPLFDEEELAREKEVILEEMRREEDNPARMVSENLFRTAFVHHHYGRPIIGYPKTVKSFTRDQILNFYHRWYSPPNISFVAVGDFVTDEMLGAIRRHFSGFKAQPSPLPAIPKEPPQREPRLVIKSMNIQSTYLAMGFRIPNIVHADIPALDVLGHIMGGAESSRLKQVVKEKLKLVHNIYSYALTPKDPGLFVIGAMLDDSNIVRAIRAILGELERLKTEPVTSEELSRAKINIRSAEIYEKETVGGQGGKIVYFLATAGSPEFENRYYQMLSDVGRGPVREVAERYLDLNSCTLALAVPDGSRLERSAARIKDTLLTRKSRPSRHKIIKANKPSRIRLKNGSTLVVVENHNLPIVAICAAAPGGTRFETVRNNGISSLTAHAITKGTSSRSAIAIAKEIEKMAGNIDGFAGRNTIGVKCEFLSEHLHDGFTVFADVLSHPAFSEEEVSKERRLQLKAIKDYEDALPSLAFSEFLKALYPRHPYGLRGIGTAEAVKKLRREELIRYHKNIFHAGGLVISVVGDVNPREVEDIANTLLKDLPRGRTITPQIPTDPRPTSRREATVIKRKKQQTHIVLGFMGTTYKSHDRYAMVVLNNILAGQGGRLFHSLRDKMGLAYAVSSVNQEGVEPGHFAVYIGTEPGKVSKAIDGILEELGRIIKEPVSEEEMERSRQFLVGTYELDLQRLGTVADVYAFNAVYGIGMDEVEQYPNRILAVTRDEVLATARRYINPDAYTLAMVKPGS